VPKSVFVAKDFGAWPSFNDRAGPAAPVALLRDDLQKRYPLPVRRQEDGQNPEELVTRHHY